MATRPYPSFLIYLDQAGEYRWRCEAANGRIMADSGEGYRNYQDCRDAIGKVGKAASEPVWRDPEVSRRHP